MSEVISETLLRRTSSGGTNQRSLVSIESQSLHEDSTTNVNSGNNHVHHPQRFQSLEGILITARSWLTSHGKGRKLGNVFIYGGFSIGPDYQGVFASVTIAILLFLFSFRLIVASSQTNLMLTQLLESILIVLSVLTCYFYSKCAFGDPGFLHNDYEYPPEAKLGYVCGECDLQKSRDHSHCFNCGCCVYIRENHCAWIGKCIGSNTSSAFQKFNMCWGLQVMYLIFLIVNYALSDS